jgi:hypothetical protein
MDIATYLVIITNNEFGLDGFIDHSFTITRNHNNLQ